MLDQFSGELHSSLKLNKVFIYITNMLVNETLKGITMLHLTLVEVKVKLNFMHSFLKKVL